MAYKLKWYLDTRKLDKDGRVDCIWLSITWGALG